MTIRHPLAAAALQVPHGRPLSLHRQVLDHAALAAVDFVLVHVPARNERVALAEAGVRLAGGAFEGDQVVEGRVELREAAVDFLAPLLDANAHAAAIGAGLGEVKLRC